MPKYLIVNFITVERQKNLVQFSQHKVICQQKRINISQAIEKKSRNFTLCKTKGGVVLII